MTDDEREFIEYQAGLDLVQAYFEGKVRKFINELESDIEDLFGVSIDCLDGCIRNLDELDKSARIARVIASEMGTAC
jgi:hypothetical protein